MAKTRLKIADRHDIFLYKTKVENLFINEFLPSAPGDYVKVYLFGLMYAQYEEELDALDIGRSLGMTEAEVEEAWDYWAANGLVTRSKDGSTIEYNRMVERFYGKNLTMNIPAEESAEPADDNFDDEEVDTYFDFDTVRDTATEEKSKQDREMRMRETMGYDRSLTSEQLRMIFERFQEVSGRTISRRETDKLTDALKIYEIKPEVLYYAIDYCADIDMYSVDYIFKVALRWKEEGCEDRTAVKALLDKHSERSIAYREIFKAVGFNRLTTSADREIMDRWFDEMGYELSEILEACKATGGIREPSLKYVNKILENKMLEKGGIKTGSESGSSNDTGEAKVSRKVLREYYEHLREEAEKEHAARIREALSKVPGMYEVIEKENELNANVAGFIMGAGAKERRARMREERKNIDDTKKRLLSSAGYPYDYLEKKYRCNICKDTGYTDEGTVCSCCRARADEAYMWNMEKNKS